MDKVIPSTLKRLEDFHLNLYKTAMLSHFEKMTNGMLRLEIEGDSRRYSFGLGNKIRANLKINDPNFFPQLVNYGEVGFGESFVEGHWQTDDLVELLKWLLTNIEGLTNSFDPRFRQITSNLLRLKKVFSSENLSSFDKNVSYYYDLDLAFFKHFLDRSLTYSGGIFKQSQYSLEQAQLAKNIQIGLQLKLNSDHKVLELGCGWGSLAIFLASTYGCHVTCLTVSEGQYKHICQRVVSLNLSHLITPILTDYRSFIGKFDRIVSIELIDSLVAQDLHPFFAQCQQMLRPSGLMVHQVIVSLITDKSQSVASKWIQRYITPGALTPSVAELYSSISNNTALRVNQIFDIGRDYGTTFQHWRQRFKTSGESLLDLGFDSKFLRTWDYYLAYTEAAYEVGAISCIQLTASDNQSKLH